MSTNQARTPQGARGGVATPREAEPPPPERNRPVYVERIGHVKAAIWANDGGHSGVYYTATLSRVYKDAENNWQSTERLGRDDLLIAAKVLDRAHTWICDMLQSQGASGQSPQGS